MKKLRFVWVLFSLLVFLTSLAAAPLAGSAISLVEVRTDPAGGVIFIFNVSGEFSNSELKGFVEVQSEDANYDLHCTQKDDTTVHCTTSRKTAGKNVVVTFGGTTFFTFVPETRPICYPVYDYGFDNPSVWQLIGHNCQSESAQNGDMINFYNDYGWDQWYDYEYMDPSTLECVNFGAGYYYPFCPFSIPT